MAANDLADCLEELRDRLHTGALFDLGPWATDRYYWYDVELRAGYLLGEVEVVFGSG